MAVDIKAVDEPAEPEEAKPVGRPLLFGSVDELDRQINSYFDHCDPHIEERLAETGINQRGETIWAKREVMTEQRPYTMTGLARHLNVDRKTLLNYSKKEAFFPSIQRALDRCHEFTEEQLYTRAANGAKFSLTNNFEWEEKSSVDHTTLGKPMTALVEIVRSGDGTSSKD